ncbi:MAG: hypothetical protein IH988_01785 [Planctomycetes bacterium]|nr:hypothetical protein [Planctomycetota bacterium]
MSLRGGRSWLLLVAWIAVAVAVAVAIWTPDGQAQETRRVAPPPDPGHVQELIRRLADPSYEVRTRATWELCALGPPAVGALRRAAQSDEFEIALRARSVLEVFEQIHFGGVEISLEASRNRLSWDETVDLTLTFKNVSAYPARVPLIVSPAAGMSADVRQVTGVLDVADYLRVVGPRSEAVALHVDDITADPQVADAVEARIDGGPEATLDPGATLVYRVEDFNRGWARYPLLSAGTYSLQFVYIPPWDDERMAREEIGRVESNAIELRVTDDPPPVVNGPDLSAVLTLEWQNTAAVARLISTSDLPIAVNLNIDKGQPPFAALTWQTASGPGWRDLTIAGRRHGEGLVFDSALVIEIVPGDAVEVGRVSRDELRAALGGDLHDLRSLRIRAEYSNRTGRQWLRRSAPRPNQPDHAPEPSPPTLPRRTFFGRVTSNVLTGPPGD